MSNKAVFIRTVFFCEIKILKLRGKRVLKLTLLIDIIFTHVERQSSTLEIFNPKMMKVSAGIGDPCKVHHTYRKIFDTSIEFERCPEMA
jgi:hypothetical protein